MGDADARETHINMSMGRNLRHQAPNQVLLTSNIVFYSLVYT